MNLKLPRLMVITDWTLPAPTLLSQLEEALRAGPRVCIQHRNPNAPIREFLEQGRILKSLCERYGNSLFINGRLDVALLLGAHLHLPSQGLRPAEVRPHLGASRWISISVHSEEEALSAQGADLALLSPVFSPGSKTGVRTVLGPEGFDRLAKHVPCPAFALGGLTPERARTVPGAAGFAAVSSILSARNPLQTAHEFLTLPAEESPP